MVLKNNDNLLNSTTLVYFIQNNIHTLQVGDIVCLKEQFKNAYDISNTHNATIICFEFDQTFSKFVNHIRYRVNLRFDCDTYGSVLPVMLQKVE